MEKKNAKTEYSHYTSKLLAVTLMTILTSVLAGQELSQDTPALRDRLFFGGNFSLQFGTITNIEVSPVVGIWLLPKLAVAAGPSFSYYKIEQLKTETYGGRAYLQFVVFQDLDKFIPLGIHTSLFLHGEDEMLSLEPGTLPNTSDKTSRFLVNTVLAGGGISQQVGQKAAVNIMVLWTLNDSGYQLYSNPEIRIGFTF